MRLALIPFSLTLIASSPAPAPAVPAAVITIFTAGADQLYPIVEPGCVLTTRPEFVARFKPWLERTTAMERRAAGTVFAPILAKARADQIELAKVIDCAAPDGPRTAEYVDTEIQTLEQLLPRMEQTVAHYTAEG